MIKKIIFVVVMFTLLFITSYIIDRKYYMLKRVERHGWQSRGGKDYGIVGKDLLGIDDYELRGDTLMVWQGKQAGRRFIVRYCIFDNLWIETMDTQEIAWYIY